MQKAAPWKATSCGEQTGDAVSLPHALPLMESWRTMATIDRTLSTGIQRADVRPFDAQRSAKLDELIQKLDDSPPRLRAHLYRLHKRWLERQVPASYGRTGR